MEQDKEVLNKTELNNNVENVDNTHNVENSNVNNEEEVKSEKKETTEQKQKIVPSYAQNNKSKDNKVKSKNTRHISKIWIIIVAVLVIIAAITVWFVVENNIDYTPYEESFDTMNMYGFNIFYDNESAKMNEKVNYSEAVKMILATTLKIDNVSDYLYTEDEEKYKNENWIKLAQNVEFMQTTSEKEENYDNHISYIDCIMLLAKAKTVLLEDDLDTDVSPNFADFDEYTNEEQIAIKDMVSNKIIDNTSDKLNAKKNVRKAFLNKMIVNFVKKYNLITVDGAKLNINPEKLPSNVDSYPYILSSIDKKVYEMSFYIKDADKFVLPVDLFKTQRRNYETIKFRVESYFNTILNIDYETINKDMFTLMLEDSLLYRQNDTKITEYINYVKENKIKATGKATIIYPVVYFDGEDYRVRVKVTYNVESSNNLNNVFYLDDNTTQTYSIGEKSMYLEVPLLTQAGVDNIFMTPGNINDWISGKIKD